VDWVVFLSYYDDRGAVSRQRRVPVAEFGGLCWCGLQCVAVAVVFVEGCWIFLVQRRALTSVRIRRAFAYLRLVSCIGTGVVCFVLAVFSSSLWGSRPRELGGKVDVGK